MQPPLPALDLIFPPGECVWQAEAESYVKYGTTGGAPVRHMGYDAHNLDAMHSPQVVVYD